MKLRSLHLAVLIALAASPFAPAEDDWYNRVDDFLTVSALHGKVRARLSGTLDLEAYSLPTPPGGLIYSDTSSFLNPRLTVFLDAQLGPNVYIFSQARADRGFDPGYEEARVGLDEYALRVTPWKDGRFSFQIGRFATFVGNWALRHGSWENPFINAPLPYENLTGMWDSSPADTLAGLRSWSGFPDGETYTEAEVLENRRWRVPLIWGPSYNSGLAAFGQIGKFEYAAELKNTALCSRPESWDGTAVGWEYPTIGGRLGYKPNQSWNFGVSASSGTYLVPDWAEGTLKEGTGYGDYRETIIGQDFRFEWHQWQVWAEIYEARFSDPYIGNADSLAYYIETKYKFTPQLFGAVRWGQQLFNSLPNEEGVEEPWGGDIWRADFALGYRFTAWSQLKLQYTVEGREVDGGGIANMFAAQFTLRF